MMPPFAAIRGIACVAPCGVPNWAASAASVFPAYKLAAASGFIAALPAIEEPTTGEPAVDVGEVGLTLLAPTTVGCMDCSRNLLNSLCFYF